mmetsp:Transcript_51344/g.59998  ORF Transcript_51344/g.59998 Transcript_51344/m.59998 type:complete len:201 (+) Transcript_51344:138-740(+)
MLRSSRYRTQLSSSPKGLSWNVIVCMIFRDQNLPSPLRTLQCPKIAFHSLPFANTICSVGYHFLRVDVVMCHSIPVAVRRGAIGNQNWLRTFAAEIATAWRKLLRHFECLAPPLPKNSNGASHSSFVYRHNIHRFTTTNPVPTILVLRFAIRETGFHQSYTIPLHRFGQQTAVGHERRFRFQDSRDIQFHERWFREGSGR